MIHRSPSPFIICLYVYGGGVKDYHITLGQEAVDAAVGQAEAAAALLGRVGGMLREHAAGASSAPKMISNMVPRAPNGLHPTLRPC